MQFLPKGSNRFKKISTIAGFIWGIPLFLFSFFGIMGRAQIDVSGTILESSTLCEQPSNNRCVTNYTIQSDMDGSSIRYSAGPNDQSLNPPRGTFPSGTAIQKHRWSLKYSVNGKVVDDFPLVLYLIDGIVGLSLLLTGLIGSIYFIRKYGLGKLLSGESLD
ncbi:MAG: hypothetical protein HY282_08800 [Nitrospirae bacterium]|nr:hypothetical protein [Candidatus Manganitrophaceae bacterium]